MLLIASDNRKPPVIEVSDLYHHTADFRSNQSLLITAFDFPLHPKSHFNHIARGTGKRPILFNRTGSYQCEFWKFYGK